MRTTAFLACIMAAITASAEILIGNGDRIAFLGDSITANGNRPAPGHLPRPWSSIRTSGPIGFQGMHGGALPYFRNVRIRSVK